jgi:hypothetical protein
MNDTYTPAPPMGATCPHCGATIPTGAPASPHVRASYLDWLCPACGEPWCELRGTRFEPPGQPQGVRRYWDPA